MYELYAKGVYMRYYTYIKPGPDKLKEHSAEEAKTHLLLHLVTISTSLRFLY